VSLRGGGASERGEGARGFAVVDGKFRQEKIGAERVDAGIPVVVAVVEVASGGCRVGLFAEGFDLEGGRRVPEVAGYRRDGLGP